MPTGHSLSKAKSWNIPSCPNPKLIPLPFPPAEATDGPASCYHMNEKGAYYGYCRKEKGTHMPCKKK